MEDTAERVKKLITEHLGVDQAQVTGEATLADDLGADSLDIVELEMAFEEDFGGTFCDRDLFELHSTVDQVIAAVDQARAG